MLKANITDADIFGGEDKLVDDISRYGSRGILLDERNLCAVLVADAENYYKLPGGGIELGERESDAFIRETQEETGYKCTIITQLGTVAEHKGKSGFCQFSFAYLARKTAGAAATKVDPLLGFSLKWMTLEESKETFKKAFDENSDIKMKFMLKRDLTIIEYLIESIASGEVEI